MKLPFTDKFLWMVYNFFEQTGDALDTLRIRWPSMRRLTAIDDEFWRDLERKRDKKHFRQFIDYLKRRGYIQAAALKEKKGILLTSKGKQLALKTKLSFENPLGDLRKREDGKCLMVIFDIPEKKRRYRDDLRFFLSALGFRQFQKSVWVSPYDIKKQLDEVIMVYGLEDFVHIVLIEEVEIK